MNLQKKIILSELLLDKAFSRIKNLKEINILWSGGKDSTVLLHLIKKKYNGKIPISVVFADSLMEFPQIYDFVDKLSKDWNMDILRVNFLSKKILKRIKVTKNFKLYSQERDRSVKEFIMKNKFKMTFWGIRWYEHFHKINRFFGKRYGIEMVYPILHWTQNDIWEYIRLHNIPYVSLYDDGYLHLDSTIFSVKQEKRLNIDNIHVTDTILS